MSLFDRGRTLRRVPLGVLCAVAGCLTGGCAADRTSGIAAPDFFAGGPPPPPPAPAAVEMEGDGRPAQVAPLRSDRRGERDDPTQPWSPRYGSVAPLLAKGAT